MTGPSIQPDELSQKCLVCYFAGHRHCSKSFFTLVWVFLLSFLLVALSRPEAAKTSASPLMLDVAQVFRALVSVLALVAAFQQASAVQILWAGVPRGAVLQAEDFSPRVPRS